MGELMSNNGNSNTEQSILQAMMRHCAPRHAANLNRESRGCASPR